jgi:aspartyl-tRNA(Asn)/glutamyl-tRNA(Gln) amidotransferase subunit A
MPAEPETIAGLAQRLQTRTVTAEAVTDACLRQIAEKNATFNAFITVFDEAARTAARGADREIAAGHYRGPLHGVPVSLKDLIDVRGTPTTAASRVREGHMASADAVVVERLRHAGAIIIGKCNLHEFAFGTTNEDSAFGPARHPLDPSRSPGGSSGGSAVSVALDMAYASIGTDTGGSIRIPAAACGLVGLKPSRGEISTAGVVPLSQTLDHVGPLCRSVQDAEIVYQAIGGTPSPFLPLHARRSPVRLGVLRDYFLSLLDEQVAEAFDQACERLRRHGVTIADVAIPHADDIAAIYLHIVLSEAAAFHATTLDRLPTAYTEPVRLRLEMGRYVLAEDYLRALQGREVLHREVSQALEGHDALLLPALAIPAPPLGASTVRVGGSAEPIRTIMLRLTQLFNLTGHPTLTVPCGQTGDGLPVGAQLVGAPNCTGSLLQLARSLEPSFTDGSGATPTPAIQPTS